MNKKGKDTALKKGLQSGISHTHHFLDILNDWVWEMDTNGIHTYSNQAVERILGYKQEEIVGQHVSLVWPEASKDASKLDTFNDELKDGIPWQNYRGFFRHIDGRTIILESSGVPIFNDQGQLIGYRGIDRDITDTLEKERELKEAKEKYQQENEFKMLLLDIISHDILNSVNSITGLSELLQYELPDNPKIEALYHSGLNLAHIITNAITLSQLSSGTTIETGRLGVKDLFHQSIKTYKEIIAQKQAQVLVQTSDEHVIQANPIIAEVFNNFLDNALKFAEPGSTIIMESKTRKNKLLCSVMDENKPIDRQEKETIFHHGTRKNNRQSGRGIGLSIVHRIAKAHGTNVGVTARGKKGNMFFIECEIASPAK